jgi:hypothetical protein
MAAYLFWNLGRKPHVDLIGSACREHEVDVLILAEPGARSAEILRSLNTAGEFRFDEFLTVPSSIKFFHRFPSNSMHAVFDDGSR